MSRASERRFLVSEDRIRAYSRRGNYHSDRADGGGARACPASSRKACRSTARPTAHCSTSGATTFLEHGEIDVRFVGVVMAEEEIVADVAIDDGTATISVENASTGRTAAVGEARREATQ